MFKTSHRMYQIWSVSQKPTDAWAEVCMVDENDPRGSVLVNTQSVTQTDSTLAMIYGWNDMHLDLPNHAWS